MYTTFRQSFLHPGCAFPGFFSFAVRLVLDSRGSLSMGTKVKLVAVGVGLENFPNQ